MPYCHYCGNYVRNGVCAKYYHKPLDSHRKEQHPGDCGFGERLATFATVILILYFSSFYIFKFFNLIAGLLNK